MTTEQEEERRFIASVFAMQGIVSNIIVPPMEMDIRRIEIAKLAVMQADTLIAELKK